MEKEASTKLERHSWDIDLRAFRQIMFLPMAIETIEDMPKLRNWSPSGDWKNIDIAKAHAPRHALQERLSKTEDEEAQRRQFFAEAAYFHPSVRTLLYGRPAASAHEPTQARAAKPRRGHDFEEVRLFRHSLAGGRLGIVCGYGATDGLPRGPEGRCVHAFEVELNIDRCDLYVWSDPGVAVFLIEVCGSTSAPGKLFRASQNGESDESIGGTAHTPAGDLPSFTLAEALAVQDALRRVYPPFFSSEHGALTFPSGLFPSAVSLNGERFAFTDKEAGDCLFALADRGSTPLAPWWRHILQSLVIDDWSNTPSTAPRWRQIVDDRMPTLVHAVPDQLGAIRRGDLVRLCFADSPGNGTDPYDKGFLSQFEEHYCYDRFRDKGTLYMASNYSFACVAGLEAPAYLQNHLRRHYTQMFLLVQLQRACLLMFSHWMAEAMSKAKGSFLKGQLATRLTEIRNAFAAFTHRIWFGNVSNQMQARELFDLMQRHSGARELFEEVSDECDVSAQTLDRIAQQRQQSSAMTLNALFALSAIVTTPLVIVQGIALFGPAPHWAIAPSAYGSIVAMLLVLTALVVAAAARLQAEGKLLPIPWIFLAKSHSLDAGLLRAVRLFCLVFAMAALAAFLFARFPELFLHGSP